MPNAAKFFLCVLVALVTGCTPHMAKTGSGMQTPVIEKNTFNTRDGTTLPLRVWGTPDAPQAILIGVHGFNDYGNFLNPGFPAFLNERGVTLITYDQRGFGDAPFRGKWAGRGTMVQDLSALIHLLKAQHKNTPLYVLGESMGGAVVINTVTQNSALPIDGVILSAPAVWGMSTWPWYQKLALKVFAHTMPWLKLSGGGFVQPTDHMETWKNWSRDPLVIRETRVDALWGVSHLMEDALHAAPALTTNTLVLYGAKDEVIPPKATARFVNSLPEKVKVALYPKGWHMLTRDHNGPVVWKDILHWMINPKDTSLPSKADLGARHKISELD